MVIRFWTSQCVQYHLSALCPLCPRRFLSTPPKRLSPENGIDEKCLKQFRFWLKPGMMWDLIGVHHGYLNWCWHRTMGRTQFPWGCSKVCRSLLQGQGQAKSVAIVLPPIQILATRLDPALITNGLIHHQFDQAQAYYNNVIFLFLPASRLTLQVMYNT